MKKFLSRIFLAIVVLSLTYKGANITAAGAEYVGEQENLNNIASKSEAAISTENSFLENELKKAEEDIDALPEDWTNVIGINLVNGYSPTKNGVVWVRDAEDEFYITFQSGKSEEMEYMLKILVDYQEAEFVIGGEVYGQYRFRAKGDDNFVIPFRFRDGFLNLDSGHIITVAVFQNPDKKSYEEEFLQQCVIRDFEAAAEGRNRGIVSETGPEQENGDVFLEIPFSGIMLNTDFSMVDSEQVFLPPAFIRTYPGEKISIAFRAGNFADTEKCAIILLTDWEQTPIDGESFRYIKNEEGKVTGGTLNFDAPKEPGEYEVISFVSQHPFEERTSEMLTGNSASNRFTLIVEGGGKDSGDTLESQELVPDNLESDTDNPEAKVSLIGSRESCYARTDAQQKVFLIRAKCDVNNNGRSVSTSGWTEKHNASTVSSGEVRAASDNCTYTAYGEAQKTESSVLYSGSIIKVMTR